jgi:alkylhydroperoxidase family enzyme
MSWIEMLEEEVVLARTDRLARIYRACIEPGETRVDHVLKVHSLRPRTMEAHLMLYKTAMHVPGGVSRRERESIAVAVSAANGCHY